jgi:hypothetical protein
MKRIKIEDLPKDMQISQEELRKVRGGFQYANLGRKAMIGDYYGPWGSRTSTASIGKIPSIRNWLDIGDISAG